MKLLKNEDISNCRHDMLEVDKEKKVKNKLVTNFLPEITASELKVVHGKVLDDLPHMTLQSALWKHSPVTVKHVKRQEGGRTLVRREVDILRRLQHPRLAKLLAVCLDPNPDHLCLVMEHFQFASLNHLLHKTQVKMSLPERINLLMDIAKGMIYIHSLSIIHGFLNSFSVFIDEKLRAKIGNLEFSQKVGDMKHEFACRGIQKNWMAPEQMLHKPPDTYTASDVYSFGALMWETLARKVPWSWLTGITLKQALCRDRKTLPMLEIWPGEIQSIMKECFSDPVDRPNFCSVHEYLSTIENSGGGLTSEVLDGAFPDWCELHVGSIHNGTQRVWTRGTSEAQPSLSTVRKSEIYVMRRRSSSKANERRRSIHLTGGLKDTLTMFSNKKQTRREREVEQYGYQIAKQLELVRDIRRRSRKYSRPTWAKEVALTRAIARDLGRVQNYTWKTYDTTSKDRTSIRHGRKHSVLNEDTFYRLLMTSSKYLKKDWSKVLHGMEKLKNSMRGLREKVKEELSVSGEGNLVECDSFSETGEVKTVFENTATVRESATLFPSLENETTIKTVSLKKNMQEGHHSKDSSHGRPQSLDEPFKGKREHVRKEKGAQLSATITNSADKADSRETSKGAEFGCNFMDDTLQGSANAEACRSRRKLVTSKLIEKHPPNTHLVAIALASPSTEVADTRDTLKVARIGSNVNSNTLHCSVNTEPCGSRKNSLTSELTEKRRSRAHSVVKVEVSPSAEIADTQDTSEAKEFARKVKSNTLYCGVNAEPCGSRKNSLTSEFTGKRRPRAHSAAKAEASQSVEVADTRDTSEGNEFGSNLNGNNLHCSVNTEASRSGENYVTPELTEKIQLRAHSVAKVEASPSADVADTRDTSKATEFGNKLEGYTLHCSLNAVECCSRRNFMTSELVEKRQLSTHSVTKGESGSSAAIADTRDNGEVTAFGSTQQCNVNSEAYRSRKKSAVSEIPEKCKVEAHLAVKAEPSAVRSSKLIDLPRETQTNGTERPESLTESLTESRGGRCNDVDVKSFQTKSLVTRPIGEHQNIHRMRPQSTRQVQESLFDVSAAMLNGKGIKKDWTSPPCEHNRLHDASLKGESVQEPPKGQMLKQEFSFRDNDELAGNIDESESVVRGKTFPSISGGSVVMKSNILRHSTETNSDISKKFDEAKDGKREGATIQLSPAFSGVRRCEPRRERLSSLRQELGGRNYFNPKTMSFGTKETSSVLSLEGDTLVSRKKLKKVRSNSLGQEPTEGLTMKCNSLMTESVGRDDSALGNPKLQTYGRFAVGSSELSKLRRESFSSELNSKLRLSSGSEVRERKE